MKYLVTGRSGSGKTTICKDLQRRGYTSTDADKVPGVCRWEDVKTGQPLKQDPSGYIDYNKVAWNWNERALKKLLHANKDLILCGSSSNQLEFHPLFDKVFILILGPEEQRQRILNRKGKEYGKHPELLKETLEDQKAFAQQALKLGAIPIDAEQPLEKIVDEILSYTNES